MKNRPNAVVGLLAAIAVLLAAHLVVQASKPAEAGGVAGGGDPCPGDINSDAVVDVGGGLVRVRHAGDPYIVELLPMTGEQYIRVWSDGRVDRMAGNDCAYAVDPLYSHGPVEHPVPVVAAQSVHIALGDAVMLTYQDGRVDLLEGPVAENPRCTIAGIGTPSLCTADVDRDGDVDVTDFLALLNQWGPCQ